MLQFHFKMSFFFFFYYHKSLSYFCTVALRVKTQHVRKHKNISENTGTFHSLYFVLFRPCEENTILLNVVFVS